MNAQPSGKRGDVLELQTGRGTFAFAVKASYSVQYCGGFKCIYINCRYGSWIIMSTGFPGYARNRQNHCRPRKEGRYRELQLLAALDNRSSKPVEEKICREILQNSVFAEMSFSIALHNKQTNKQTNKLHGLNPRANYTDRTTTACRRSDCQHLRIKGATWSAWRIPTAVFSIF
jgi:hypothetical protein